MTSLDCALPQPRASATSRAPNYRLPGASLFVLAGLMIMLSDVARQGADLLWGVAMGDRIRAGEGVPQSVPFAAAPSRGWANPMAAGEILLSFVNSLGSPSLVVLHLVLVAVALGALITYAVAINRREGRASLALVLVVVGGSATLAIARMSSLSLLPFALLVVLLMHQSDRPSSRLWLVVPLIGIWGNLHGGVLVGCALLLVHLICCGGHVRRRVLVGFSALVAVFCATSAGWHTASYYWGVLTNEAALQHAGLWARLDIKNPFDLIMMLAVGGLVAMWVRSQPRLWEVVAVVGMVGATAMASRNAIWLVLFLLPLAARGQSRMDALEVGRFPWKPAAAAFALLIVGVGWQLTTRGAALSAPGSGAIAAVRSLAAGRTVLAIDPVDETFTQAGIRIWAGNPIDAFPRRVQQQFLTFMDNGSIPPDASISLIVVDDRLAGSVRAQGWRQVASVDDLRLFERPSPGLTTTRGASR